MVDAMLDGTPVRKKIHRDGKVIAEREVILKPGAVTSPVSARR
jgi:hypothetical protein